MTVIQTPRRARMHVAEESTIRLIPLEDIRVLNPRARNKQVFAKLVENISALGLKRPITVAPTTNGRPARKTFAQRNSAFFDPAITCGQSMNLHVTIHSLYSNDLTITKLILAL